MASIRIKVSRGGRTSTSDDYTSVGKPDEIEIDVPVPDRVDVYAANFIRPAEYVALISTTFDKTAELVDAVRGRDEIVDAEIAAEDDEVFA